MEQPSDLIWTSVCSALSWRGGAVAGDDSWWTTAWTVTVHGSNFFSYNRQMAAVDYTVSGQCSLQWRTTELIHVLAGFPKHPSDSLRNHQRCWRRRQCSPPVPRPTHSLRSHSWSHASWEWLVYAFDVLQIVLLGTKCYQTFLTPHRTELAYLYVVCILFVVTKSLAHLRNFMFFHGVFFTFGIDLWTDKT